MSSEGSLDWVDGSRGREEWINLGFIVKSELWERVDGLGEGVKEREVLGWDFDVKVG